MYAILTSFNICIFLLILLLNKSHAFDDQYEACLRPRNCTHGPNIIFPFYIQGLQEPYCGYPGFHVNCSETGFPILNFSHNQYVMEDIFYQNRSLRVSNSVFSGLNSTSCVPRIHNTTLPSQFRYVNRRAYLNLFYNCTNPLPGNLSEYRLGCDDDDNLGLYDDDEKLRGAFEICERNIIVPVERPREFGIVNVVEALTRGFVMNWTASDCSKCEESGGRCGFNSTTYLFICFCPDRPHSRSCKPENNTTKVISAAENNTTKVISAAGISGGSVILICLIGSCIFWCRKKRIKGSYILSRNISFDPSSKSDEGGSFYYGIPIFCYNELEEITNNFDPSKELGDGGFGTVYYGKLRDGREVAIKRLYEHNYKREQQFMNEIKILTCLKHKNLVTLYGCTSRRSHELLLIYEYISNGTVADHLHGNLAKESPLTWPIRMNIAIETASALSYLHKSEIVHRDVKTNNILLDNNFCVKVADFGLSRLFPLDVTHISTAPQGTPGYVDPEYHQCYQLTDKSDVYSFGVVLVELISSMPAVDISRHRHEINLANLAVNRIQRCAFDELIDSNLGYKSDSEVARMTTSVAELAFQCLQLNKDLRPTMDEVLEFLKEICNGVEFKFEDREDDGEKIPPSPETDDVKLFKKVRFQSSPVAVTDIWTSGTNTTASSSIG